MTRVGKWLGGASLGFIQGVIGTMWKRSIMRKRVRIIEMILERVTLGRSVLGKLRELNNVVFFLSSRFFYFILSSLP